MTDQPRGFVENEKALILEDNIELRIDHFKDGNPR
jgi:hypothetical protein